jgi:hypothetical protein
MKTKDYKQVGGLPPELPHLIGSDDIAWYHLSSISYKACSPEYLFAYRFHRKSTSYSIDLVSLETVLNMYYSILDEHGYLDEKKNEEATMSFLKQSFTGRRRRMLVDLIKDSDGSLWDEYWQMKKRLQNESSGSILSHSPDRISKILEVIGTFPSPVRKPLIWSIDLIGNITREHR